MGERKEWMWKSTIRTTPFVVHVRDHRWHLFNEHGYYLHRHPEGYIRLALRAGEPPSGSGAPRLGVSCGAEDVHSGELKYGESYDIYLAFRNGHGGLMPGGYLVAKDEGDLIYEISPYPQKNLYLSDNPRYEWKFTGKSTGTTVNSEEPFGLYNEFASDWLVFMETEQFGPRLMWDSYADIEPEHRTTSVWLQPNIPHEGLIVWDGRWPLRGEPSWPGAYLERVEVVQQHYGELLVLFLNYDTGQYSVEVWQGEAMTPAQMSEAFGSEEPPLPVEFYAIAAADPLLARAAKSLSIEETVRAFGAERSQVLQKLRVIASGAPPGIGTVPRSEALPSDDGPGPILLNVGWYG